MAIGMDWRFGTSIIAKGEEGLGNETRGAFDRIR